MNKPESNEAAERASGSLERMVRCEGWVILHPDNKMELDYFHSKLDYEKYGGPPISKEEWMRRYRPDCTLHRVEIAIAPNEKGQR